MNPVDSIYLDFAKEFDTVPHRRLLLKFEKYGVTGQIMKKIEAFLSGRTQRVEIKGLIPSWTHFPRFRIRYSII